MARLPDWKMLRFCRSITRSRCLLLLHISFQKMSPSLKAFLHLFFLHRWSCLEKKHLVETLYSFMIIQTTSFSLLIPPNPSCNSTATDKVPLCRFFISILMDPLYRERRKNDQCCVTRYVFKHGQPKCPSSPSENDPGLKIQVQTLADIN